MFAATYHQVACIEFAKPVHEGVIVWIFLVSPSQTYPTVRRTIVMVRSQKVRAVISQIVHLCEFCNSCDHSSCAFFFAFDDVTYNNPQNCSTSIAAIKSLILSLVKPNRQRFHTYLMIQSISFVFHLITICMKELSFFRTAIHLNIDIACVDASPKELVPNGLRVDVPLLIHLPMINR